MRIASIDIGTNTFRILISEPEDGRLKRVYIDRVITRLGGGFKDGERLISPDAMERAITVLRGFARVLERYGVERLRAVATGVVRESLNGSEFIKRVKSETGIEVESISGEEEARLTVKGVLRSLSLDSGSFMVFDIGGGSTEYAYVKEGNILGLTSTGLGVVYLSERFLNDDMPSESNIGILSRFIEDVLSRELSWMSRFREDDFSLVGTAGTPTTLAAMELGLDSYDPDLVNGFILRHDAVLRILNTLVDIPKEKRLEMNGLEKGREDVIIPGSLILIKTMEAFSKDRVFVSDGGLLEGIIYSIVP